MKTNWEPNLDRAMRETGPLAEYNSKVSHRLRFAQALNEQSSEHRWEVIRSRGIKLVFWTGFITLLALNAARLHA